MIIVSLIGIIWWLYRNKDPCISCIKNYLKLWHKNKHLELYKLFEF